ncbi:hypothetical protein CEXT_56741 [Caerostris extrusa]|uniref:Uncharacterized protein n=1 Tax=Caerostris extrusa TaxID=172846 RepID=A0AAV4TTI8_CAEEX|nr:hypothetical protein CEXT_56741 [Caerostris extrusa]
MCSRPVRMEESGNYATECGGGSTANPPPRNASPSLIYSTSRRSLGNRACVRKNEKGFLCRSWLQYIH